MRPSSQWNWRPGPPPLRQTPMDHRRDGYPDPIIVALSRRGARKCPRPGELDALIAATPAPPYDYFVYPSGPVAAKLFFRHRRDALDAIVFLWTRRLAGAHPLTPRVVAGVPFPSYRAVENNHLKPLFSRHARALLDSEQVRRYERAIEQASVDIMKVTELLRRPNRLGTLYELRDKRKRLEEEKELLEGKLSEFRSAIGYILSHLGDETDRVESEEEKGDVEVFNFGDELDWCSIYCFIKRELRRLDDGLPIYSCRRRLLRDIASNQVMVLIGETGSGKSTQLVQFLADSGFATGSIVCTQPRKIAAISLAQRVREESNGCYADNFVNSCSTNSSINGFKKGVIYMTDHCLLQHCMNGTSLTGISHIIVDEAHERSLNTDLLLALIKKTLLHRYDLRLVIMSATADACKLADYFYGCCTFNVTGRTFPVEIKYVPDISAEVSWSSKRKVISDVCTSYVSDVIKMVSIIHEKEEDGAILAFLTSQVEVELACENFNDPSAIVLPMHGKLSCEEQSRVFQKFPGKRKVIFSTNVSETSLTIQGVKYVVDSGMAKDIRFEPSTGMNVLKVGRISQSSANQRAGRAGRTEAGRCYRLYSEADFQSMKMHQEPEIRKVHLGIAVLKILALGVKNVQGFEFVDAPNPDAIEKALQNLVRLGAVICKNDVFELTEAGKSMAKLGIEPRLGKLILGCFSFGLKKEGLVLAAVMANSSSIFCRVGSMEDKNKADCLKLPFCHREGDLFTLLSVYKEWEDKLESRNKWCWDNSINAKSMRRCRDTVLELEAILQDELGIIIPSFWLWNAHAPSVHDKSLKKVILSALCENIAMYSGYDRLGYEVATTGQNLQLHPGSSLLVYGTKPRWVVFGEILSISNQYLVCVTSFDHECLYSIQPPLFDVSQMENRKMHMNVITGVGSLLLKRFCGKSNHNLDSLISRIKNECMDDRIGIDIDFHKREIHVFASGKDMEKVSCIVKDAMDLEKKWLKDGCVEKYLFHGGPESSPSIALFGAGAEIRHLELDKRYLTVEISHPSARALDDKELLALVDQNVPSIANTCKFRNIGHDVADSYKWGKITFLGAEAAEQAVAKINGLEFYGHPLKLNPVRSSDHKMLPFSGIRAIVRWPRRPSKGIALVNCAQEDAKYIVEDCFALGVGGKYVNCEISAKSKDCIFVRGIPGPVSESDLYDAFHYATKRKIFDIHLLRGEAVNGPPNDRCEEALIKEIAPFMPNKQFPSRSFRVEVFNPEPKDYMMKAAITFDGHLHLEAAKALDHIEGSVLPGCLSWQKLCCQHVFHSSISCPVNVYYVIRQQLDSVLEGFKHQKGVSYNLENNANGFYRIRITANATKTIADVRKPIEQLMQGKVITDPSIILLMPQIIFSRDGTTLIKTIQRETGTYILYDRQDHNVKVFGSPMGVDTAEEKLVHELVSLQESKPLEIRLRGRTLPPDLMKDVVRRFGPDLCGLKEKIPGIKVTLNTRFHILSVRGNKEQKQKVEDVISEVAHSLDSKDGALQLPEEAACPICLCDLEDPFMLEMCGHVFCRTCLIEQCESAIRSREGFPLSCAKEGCKQFFLIADLRLLLSEDKLEELFRASLSAFVASSGGAYRFCPSPDCPNVYRVASAEETARPFICGACSVETCTRCHLECHPFISCERYREYKDDPDLSLQEWRKGKKQVKDCPTCGHTIEKIEGCNHIECKCGRHICWECLDHFDSSDECYSHLRSVHHSIV